MRNRSKGHHAFSHDALSGLACDWERVGDPGVAPHWPRTVYLPGGTEDVVRAVRQARAAGERLVVRGSGHSSNGLVTGDAVLLTERLIAVGPVDEQRLTCTMQAGAALADVDEHLRPLGLGLPVVGDHADLTAGGFASVGGISPASHRFGLFADTVAELEYVDWEGGVHRCRRGDADFRRVLGGLGRLGVITELTVDVVRVDKHGTVLRNDSFGSSNLSEFLSRSGKLVRDPGDAAYVRGLWLDVPLGEKSLQRGQFSAFRPTGPGSHKSLLSRAAEGRQRFVGSLQTRVPAGVGAVVKYAGVAGMLFPPAYATAAAIERFSDVALDATVGDPTRMLIVLAPAEQYEPLVRELLDVCTEVRQGTGAIGAIALNLKPIRSAYLSGDAQGAGHCELALYLGVDPQRMTSEVLEKLVDRIDDAAIAHGALRYMHTRTSRDPQRRRVLDPNAQYWEED